MGKKNKRVETEEKQKEKKPVNTVLSTESLQNKEEDDTALNTELNRSKKRQKKKIKQDGTVLSTELLQNKEEDNMVLSVQLKKRKKKKNKGKKQDDAVHSTELLQNKNEKEAVKGDDRPPNTELKKRKKKQKKEKTQDCQNPSDGDGNESAIAAGNAYNRSGKKKQKKEKEEADKNVSNGNGGVKDQLVQNGFNGVREGSEAATDGKTIVREDAAKRALALDEPKLGDKSLKIELSTIRPKKKESPTKVNGCKRAYIGNLPKAVVEDDIRQFFKESKIESVELALYRSQLAKHHRCRGYGHISFSDDESLENAMKKNNMMLFDRPIKVAYPVHKYVVSSKEKKKVQSDLELGEL